MYKLKERKARCFLALKDHYKALKAFQEDIKALDDSKIPLENRTKLEKDAQIMVKMLQNTTGILKESVEIINEFKNNSKTKKQKQPFLSESLIFDFNEQEGRFAKAAKNIKLGTYLLEEKPHVSCLLEAYSQSHCQNCFKRTTIPIACPDCADIV